MAVYFESSLREFLVLIVLLAVLLLFYYYKHSFAYWSRRGVIDLEPSFPFGNLKMAFLKKKVFPEIIADIYRQFKQKGVRYGGFYMLTKPILLAVDPELIKLVMTKEFQCFHDRGTFVDEVNDPLTANLFSIEGQKWRNLRINLSSLFTSGKMKMMYPILLSCSEELEKVLEEPARKAEPIDIKDILSRFTTDIIGSCAFGLECNSLQNPDTEFRLYGRKFLQFSIWDSLKIMVAFMNPKILNFFKMKVVQDEVTKFFYSAIQQTVKYREKNKVERNDMINLLIKLKNNDILSDEERILNPDTGKPLDAITFNELAAQSFVFFVAGFETSSTTMTFCLYELSTNLDIQDKVRQEILEVLKRHGGKLSFDAIMEMRFMDQVINETLRKYPPLSFLNRQCVKDFKLPNSDLVIEKGTQVFISNLGLQRDPEHFPNPEKFDPDRFTDENKTKINTYTYLPFGEGPRMCIGMRFGLMQTKVGIAVILKNYKLILDGKTELPISFDVNSFTLTHKTGVYLQATKLVC